MENEGRLQQPLFLVGAERSGSTMLRLMLDQHPEIAFEHEFDFAFAQVSDDGKVPAVDVFVRWLETVRGFDYTVDPSLSYAQLVESFLRQKQSAAGGKNYVGITLYQHFDRLSYTWPDARLIHLVRDHRDVAMSVVAKGWAGNVYIGAQPWVESERCWDSLSEKLQANQSLEVRYEQLVSAPEEMLKQVCNFMGVKYDEAMLSYTETAIHYPKPIAALASQWKRKA